MKLHLRVPFPTAEYAECAMRALGVDPPFSDTKT
ncbi:MAG: CTAG/PCC1 family protein [bacterium]